MDTGEFFCSTTVKKGCDCLDSGQTEETWFCKFLQYPGGGIARTQRLFHTTSCHLLGMGGEQGEEGSLPGRMASFWLR